MKCFYECIRYLVNDMYECTLTLRNVVKRVGSDRVLNGVDIDVEPGKIIVVRGRSGVGKTTLAKIMALITKPDEGLVRFMGLDVSHGADPSIRLKFIGYVDQFYTLLPRLTVFENVELPLKLLGVPRSERRRAVLTILKELGIAEKADRYPEELSGGERQRVAIARALVKRPSLIVADEPFSNLDDDTLSQVVKVFKRVASKGTAIVITSTDLYTDFGEDKSYVLANGKLVER